MSENKILTIHKILFDLDVDSEEAFKYYADRLSKAIQQKLPERLDRILEKLDLPGGKLVIHSLSLNLGRISDRMFENAILDAITQEIENFLLKNVKKINTEVSQAVFKPTSGGKISIKNEDFHFDSVVTIPESILLSDEVKAQKLEIVDLNNIVVNEGFKLTGQKNLNKSNITARQKKKKDEKIIDLMEVINKQFTAKSTEISKIKEDYFSEIINKGKSTKTTTDKAPTRKIDQNKSIQTEHSKAAPEKEIINLPKKLQTKQNLSQEITDSTIKVELERLPKQLTSLDKALIYYLKYGRLPSNVKYELGTTMLDVLQINQKDEAFLEELSERLKNDKIAQKRFNNLLDQAKKEPDFNPRVPKVFEDYFTALLHQLSLDSFSPRIKRYDLNDLIRFIYADNPHKLKALVKYLVLEFKTSKSWNEILDELFDKVSKPSIVKILSSFVSKGAYVNKNLNQLNRRDSKSIKEAHKELLKRLLTDQDLSDYDFQVKERRYFGEVPIYEQKSFSESELLDYYLNNNSIPFSYGVNITVNQLESIILTLSASEIRHLSFFIENRSLDYATIGALSVKAIYTLIKALQPNLLEDIKSSYLYFRHNIEAGVPENFQRSMMLYYVLNDNRKSYLEEMVQFWKEQIGDSESVIKNRWKVKDELETELSKLISLNLPKVEDELYVAPEYQSYSKDISVKNAGLVIIWPFLKIYFKMLDLLNDEGVFRSMTERARACHLLQYLAIERSYGEEFYYPLNKILTGYPLDEPLPYEITMTKKEIDVSNALLKNVIKQWNALGTSTVDGLRGSFLIRDGVIAPTGNGWLLTVENKAYDILMHKLPWGIGMIKLSWAPYILNVEWERNIM